jgi:hypothetical protein
MKGFLLAVFADTIANIVTAALAYLSLAILGIFPVYPELVLGIVFGLFSSIMGLTIASVLYYFNKPRLAARLAWISFVALLAGIVISNLLTGYPRNSWQSLLAIFIPGVIVYGGFVIYVIYRFTHGPATARPTIGDKQD